MTMIRRLGVVEVRCYKCGEIGHKLQKLERPIAIRNMDRTNNSGGAIIHQVECNVYYKDHIECKTLAMMT